MKQSAKEVSIALLASDEAATDPFYPSLIATGWSCQQFNSLPEFERTFRTERHDIILLHGTFADGDRMNVVRWVRQIQNSDVPIIFIGGPAPETEILAAYKHGIDDYITVPVRYPVLLAKIGALVRRIHPQHNELMFEPYRINTSTRHILLHGVPTDLTNKEFSFAVYLFTHVGEVVTRDTVLAKVWGLNANLKTRTVDTHASRIRRKLNLNGDDGWQLTSVYQLGYRLDRQPRERYYDVEAEMPESAIPRDHAKLEHTG